MDTSSNVVVFPTDRSKKAQLWNQMQEKLPQLASIMDTLKKQGFDPKVAVYTDETGTYTEADHNGKAVPLIKEEQLWQIDDRLMERVAHAQRVKSAAEKEADRRERLRIEAAKRRRSAK